MSQIQGAGGQPQKSPKYAPIYTGRIFNGLVTNRSPLRGTLNSLYEQFYKLSYGDVMIAGSNVEVSNRLTLIRRPGSPTFDTNSWTDVLAFDDFIVNKATADAFGTTLEEIFTMIAEPGSLYATLAGVKQFVFGDAAATGQTYMQAVGNELYFSNGTDNKKWLQSLISWAPSFEFQGVDGSSGAYPFFSTYMLTGAISATTNTQNIQQLIAIAAANITEVTVADGLLTLTCNSTGLPNTTGISYPLDANAIGASFQLWGLDTATWLNGVVITALEAITLSDTSFTVTANIEVPTAHMTYAATVDTGYLTQIGSTPVIAKTGATVPAWAAYVPNTSNNWGATSPTGNIILDGNVIWVNRGSTVENWAIAAPTTAVTTTEANSTFTKWQPNTYYAISGLIQNAGTWYQVTTPGTTGATFGTGTATFTALTTQPGTWAAHTLYNDGEYAGAYPWTPGTVTINDVVYQVGTFIPNNYDYAPDSLVIANAGGVPCVFQAQRNIGQLSGPTSIPISATFGGALSGQTAPYFSGADLTTPYIGWSAAFFDHCGYNSGATGNFIDVVYGGSVGNPVDKTSHTAVAPDAVAHGLTSLMWNYYGSESSPMQLYNVSTAGEMSASADSTPFTPSGPNFEFLQWGKIRIPVGGISVVFTIKASDAAWFGVETAAGATYTAGTTGTDESVPASTAPPPTGVGWGTQTVTPWNGYPILGGWNGANNDQIMQITIAFPTAGVFGIEFCYGKNSGGGSFDHVSFMVGANGALIVPEAATAQPWFESASTSPAFASTGFTTAPAATNNFPIAPEITNNAVGSFRNFSNGAFQGTELIWANLGPVTSFAWEAGINVTTAETAVVELTDEYFAYESGISGLTAPTWQSGLYSITPDVQPLNWINEGPLPPITPVAGAILATTDQGWLYWIALVNTLDNTVSNLSPVSLGTGPVNGNPVILPGSGINLSTLDPQVDYVAIFRTTDGGATPLLVSGLGNSYWTLPLTTYLQDGFTDSTADVDLDELIQGADAGENTPPTPGAVNVSYHLGRLWYSVGTIVYYTSGANAPSGNGNGTSPLNFDVLPSRVVRLVPTAIGMLVFTISDIYIIAGNGTANNPILPAIPYLTGVGLANYNALDINGSIIGFFTTDKQFLIFDPSAGLSYAGSPIGDQFRLNNGKPGQSWNTADVYVTWYTFGEDQGWFVGDGQFGWYKLIATPSPEIGNCWSPFATVAGGISAMQSVQTSPGVHSLLIGPLGTGPILARDLDATTDGGTTGANGNPYPAYAVFGSYVFALPGQVAKIAFITTTSVRTGSPLIIGLLIDEALPYYKGSFNMIKKWVTDPPGLPESKSFFKQRFYLSDDPDEAAYCSDMQIMVQWPAENAQNELQTFSVWGAYEVEQ
jgi:hypothetical protein